MADERILPVTGYRAHVVLIRLRQADGAIGRLAMMLPGYGYTLDMPLFYYLENLCRDLGIDVLRVETAYNQNATFGEATEAEQVQWVASDARAAWQAGLAQGNYASAIVIGKSLGTRGMAALVAEPLDLHGSVQSIWLTPLISEQSVRLALRQCGHSAQVVIGDADPHYDAAVLADLAEAGVNVVVVPGADHGLDIPGDALTSAGLLAQIITEIRDFGFR